MSVFVSGFISVPNVVFSLKRAIKPLDPSATLGDRRTENSSVFVRRSGPLNLNRAQDHSWTTSIRAINLPG